MKIIVRKYHYYLDNQMDIRPFIKSKREQLNLSRQELAAYCCIDESELRMLEDDDVWTSPISVDI